MSADFFVPGDNAMPCWRQPAGGWLVGTSVHAVPRLPHGDWRCAQDFIVTDPPYGVRVSDLVFRETLGQQKVQSIKWKAKRNLFAVGRCVLKSVLRVI